ncbi:YebG family protein [Rhodanobacter aciditrophus]|uniref:YebG family protein n=1 Tax=Rhodanobacter aciditrophus TaxID=1623218 RepID=A0ABW4AXY4_9GAMM
MPVMIKYIVERNGVEKMTFSSKAEADQYDKLLETAESLEELLRDSKTLEDEQTLGKLAMFLAENKDDVLVALGSKRKPAAKKTTKATNNTKPTAPLLEDLVIEPDADSYYEEEDSSVDYNDDEVTSEGFDNDETYNQSDAA